MRIALGLTLGTIPGLAILLLVDPRIGLALCILGAFVGSLLAIPGVSIQRVLIALLGIVFDRIAPPLRHVIDLEDADRQIPVGNEDLSTQLITWLVVPSLKKNRGGRLVLCGAISGTLLALSLVFIDWQRLSQDQPGLILPLQVVSKNEDLWFHILLMLLAGLIWGGSLASLFASAPYRRSVVFAAGFGAFLSSMIELAASKPGEPFRWGFIVPFATIGASIALFFLPLISLDIAADEIQKADDSNEKKPN